MRFGFGEVRSWGSSEYEVDDLGFDSSLWWWFDSGSPMKEKSLKDSML